MSDFLDVIQKFCVEMWSVKFKKITPRFLSVLIVLSMVGPSCEFEVLVDKGAGRDDKKFSVCQVEFMMGSFIQLNYIRQAGREVGD